MDLRENEFHRCESGSNVNIPKADFIAMNSGIFTGAGSSFVPNTTVVCIGAGSSFVPSTTVAATGDGSSCVPITTVAATGDGSSCVPTTTVVSAGDGSSCIPTTTVVSAGAGSSFVPPTTGKPCDSANDHFQSPSKLKQVQKPWTKSSTKHREARETSSSCGVMSKLQDGTHVGSPDINVNFRNTNIYKCQPGANINITDADFIAMDNEIVFQVKRTDEEEDSNSSSDEDMDTTDVTSSK